MIRLCLVALAFCALVGEPAAQAQPGSPATCADHKTGIDREQLIFFVRDGVKANELSVEIERLMALAAGAENWLASAELMNGDRAEARVNARHVVRSIEQAVPVLRARLAEMVDEGPEFPPALYWPKGWKPFVGNLIDSLEIQSGHLGEEIQLRAAQDWEGLQRLLAAREADLLAYERAGADFNRELIDLVPSDHPENVLVRMYALWDGTSDLRMERDAASDLDAAERAAAKLARRLAEIADELDQLAIELEGTLDTHGEALLPIFETLACDPADAAAGRDAYIQTYRDTAPLIGLTAEIARDLARATIELARDGASQSLFERYEEIAFRTERVWRQIGDLWTARARIMADAIAE